MPEKKPTINERGLSTSYCSPLWWLIPDKNSK
jgi:hypothetical protein